MPGAQDTTQTPVITPNEELANTLYPEKTPEAVATPAGTEDKTPAPVVENKDDKTPAPVAEKDDFKDLTLPKDALLGEEDLTAIKSLAKEQGLNSKQAQALIEKQNSQLSSYVNKWMEAHQAKVSGYESAVKSDKEIGGDNFNRSISLSKRVLERFGNESLKGEFDQTGFGSHPEVVRFLSRIGAAMGDDSIISPQAKSSPAPKSLAEKIYGTKN